jgi:membrane protease YdiL (CAAX protease family)
MAVERTWEPNGVLRLVVGVAASLCVGGIVAGALGVGEQDRFSQFVISNLTLHGSILFFVHLLLFEHRLSWSQAFGFNSPGALTGMVLALGVTVLVVPCTWMLGHLSAQAMQWMQIEPVQQEAVTTLQSTVAVFPQIYMAGAAVVLVPFAEELLFRGVLYPALKQLGRPGVAWWGSAILFGAVHFNLMTFVPLTLLGLVLAWLYERTGTLLAPVFAHSLFNLANLLLMVLVQRPLSV